MSSAKKDLVDETGTKSLDPKHAPISLPARSFDIDELQKGFEKVVDGKAEKRTDLIHAALTKAVTGDLEAADNTLMPGYERVEIENRVTGNVETTVVFNEKLAEEVKAETAAAGDGPAGSAPGANAGASSSNGE